MGHAQGWSRLVIAIAGVLAAVGGAQVAAAPSVGYQGMKIGSYVRLRPTVSATVEYDDNIFRQPTNEESDVITRIDPRFELDIGAAGGVQGLTAHYRPQFGIFMDSQDDSVVNHDLGATYTYGATRMDVVMRGGFRIQNEARGSGVSNGLAGFTTTVFDEPARFEEETLGFGLGNIGRGARTRLGLNYDQSEIEYQNFKNITRARDRENRQWRADAGYRVGGATYLNVSATLVEVDYNFTPPGQAELDSDETRIDVGFVWESTGATTARATVGYQEKEFEDGTLGDQNQFVWDIGFVWNPVDFVTLDVSTGRRFQETNREGSSVSTQDINLGYRYAFNDRVSATAGLLYAQDDYQDDAREDDFVATSLRVDYGFRSWINLGAGIALETRESNQLGADFERNVYFLQANIGL